LTGIRSLAATATDNVGVAKVKFYADGTTLLGTDTNSPYQVNWNTLSLLNGVHTFTAKASDAVGNTRISLPKSATIANTGACSAGSQKILNRGFESGTANWTSTPGVIGNSLGFAHSGSWLAWLNGYGYDHIDDVYQTVSIPVNACSAAFSFWLKITTEEATTKTQYDTMTVTVRNSAGSILTTLATYSNLNKSTGYVLKSFNLTAYKGKTIRLQFHGVENFINATNFFVDDVSLIERH